MLCYPPFSQRDLPWAASVSVIPWLGAHSEPARGKSQALPFPRASHTWLTQPCPSFSGGRCSAHVEGRMGCQGFVLGLQPSRQVLAFAVQSGSSSVSLRSWRTSSRNWFCAQGCDQLAQSLASHGLLRSGRRRQSWGGMSARFAGRLGSEPEQRAPACCRLRSPCFPAHLEQRQMLEVCHHSHASAPALAPTSP